jgi:hypothetical protein
MEGEVAWCVMDDTVMITCEKRENKKDGAALDPCSIVSGQIVKSRSMTSSVCRVRMRNRRDLHTMLLPSAATDNDNHSCKH